MKFVRLVLATTCLVPLAAQERPARSPGRPNILFAIADDWGWPHAGKYGDRVVQTPTFDLIADAGVCFEHAFVSSPSCTPSRGAILTGQYHWQLGPGANLYGTFLDRLQVFPEILQQHGYIAGCTGKTWGPGRPETRGRKLAGPRHKNFAAFLQRRPKDKPFVFWLGTSDPHRPFKRHAGERSGMDLAKVHLFPCFPDHPDVRGDVADYYVEVQRFDRLVGDALQQLEEIGELQNTIVVMTGDHGMPFPRCKSNCYDSGTRVPLAIMWGEKIPQPGRRVRAFTSLVDLAPTFLAAAGVRVPKAMAGRSLLEILTDAEHRPKGRGDVIFGKERHVPSQEKPDMGGYPTRALRNARYLYLVNYEPDRWPNGTPDFRNAAIPGNWFADTDNGPTKTYIIAHKDQDAAHRRAYDLCFAKRPAEELYDLKIDPNQLLNLAFDPAMAKVKALLRERLEARLRATGDPRMTKNGFAYDQAKYSGGGPKHPSWRKGKRKPQRRKKHPAR